MRLYQNVWMLALLGLIIIITSIVVITEDNITGNVVNTRVNIIQSLPLSCSFQLEEGWNMVSFYCFGALVNRSVALASIDGSYDSVFKYQANDPLDPWKSYNPDLPNWTVQQLNYFDRFSGYWIYMDSSFSNETNSSNITTDPLNFTYFGVYSDSNIPLYKGWNFIGYPRNVTANVTFILAGIPYTAIRTYEAATDTWYYYLNGTGGSLQIFEPFNGYWLNVSSNVTLTVLG